MTPRGARRAARHASFWSAVMGTDTDDDVDPADLGPDRWARQTADRQALARDVLKPACGFTEEVVVIGRVGIKIGAARLNHDLAHQPGVGELVQRIINGGKRDRDRRRNRLAMELFGGDMAIIAIKQQARQRKPLTCRPQPCRAQTRQYP